MTSFFVLTAISVSLDSLFCGFSLYNSKLKKLPFTLGVFLTVFLMCLVANYSTVFISKFLNEKTASLGGIILIILGFIGLLPKKKQVSSNQNGFRKAVCCGFAVGLDGSFANLSLALMGFNAFYVPFFIAVCHAVMVFLGMILSKYTVNKKAEKLSFISPLVLIALGIYKLTSLL